MTPVEERSAREVHVAAFKAAKARGYCFECASEFGFRATEAMVPTKRDRGNMCSKQGCPSRRAARVPIAIPRRKRPRVNNNRGRG